LDKERTRYYQHAQCNYEDYKVVLCVCNVYCNKYYKYSCVMCVVFTAINNTHTVVLTVPTPFIIRKHNVISNIKQVNFIV